MYFFNTLFLKLHFFYEKGVLFDKIGDYCSLPSYLTPLQCYYTSIV